MDLDGAQKAHETWRTDFAQAIENKEHLDTKMIAMDNHCELGHWLYGEARRTFERSPEFKAVVRAHKKFHLETSRLAGMVNAGRYDDAKAEFEDGSRCSKASRTVIDAIEKLKAITG